MKLPVNRGNDPVDVVAWAKQFGTPWERSDIVDEVGEDRIRSRSMAIDILNGMSKDRSHDQKFYLAGPYNEYTIIGDHGGTTFSIDSNIQIAEVYSAMLWQMGIPVFCPHLNTRGFEKLPGVEEIVVKAYLEWVQDFDGLILLPNWEHSKGTRKEVLRADQEKVPIYLLESALRDQWIPYREYREKIG